MTPAPQKKMENPQRPALTPDAMSAMQTPDPTMSSPEMLKAKNNLRRIIQQVGIDPQRIIQAGKYAEAALQDPKMYPMAIQNAVKSGLLTQEQVLGWVWQNPNLQSGVEANVQVQLDRQINPPIVTPPLPWATPAETTPAA